MKHKHPTIPMCACKSSLVEIKPCPFCGHADMSGAAPHERKTKL